MSLELYLAYLVACAVVIVVPGPSVTLIVANSLTHGTRAGVLNVVGTQLGIALVIGLVAIGLASMMTLAGWWFEWIRLAGAAYLVWLGIRMLRSTGGLGATRTATAPHMGFLAQGFLVAISNPKSLVFFGAFIPQFINPSAATLPQVALMGISAVIIGSLSDGAYAVLAGGAARRVSDRSMRAASRLCGGFLIGGGLMLAFARGR